MIKIKKISQLRKIYKEPYEAAIQKDIKKLDKHSIQFLSLSPFCIISTSGLNGSLDASPKGGEPGFIKIHNNKTILLPDWPGNNRLDSFINIIENPNIGMILFVPGIDETLRINGRAYISNDKEVLLQLKKDNKLPISFLVISIKEIYFHCARALWRSGLWNKKNLIDKSIFPTMGTILQDQIKGYDGATTDKLIKENKNKLYEEI